MNVKIIAITVTFINYLTICQCKRYENYSLYNVMPTKQEHLKFLQNLNYQRYIGLRFWQRPQKLYESVQFLVNPVSKEMFDERASNYTVQAKLVIPDIQSAFDKQIFQKYRKLNLSSFNWDNYHTFEDVYDWLSDMAGKYTKILKLSSIGKSAEGRDIQVVVFKYKNPKHKVIVEGGIHGTEWISVEFVIYLLNELTKVDKKSHWKMNSLITRYEWHIIPIVNPDGYIFNQKQDRLWRKNRNNRDNSIGVDLNRNFDYRFGKSGTSKDKNDDYYCGPHIFSEPESLALAKYITKLKKNLRFYLAFHGYGQKIVIPQGSKNSRSDNYVEVENYAKQSTALMFQKHGVRYHVGASSDLFGVQISGNSADYVKKTHNIRFVYTFLLRDNGTYGHALPPDLIVPTCQEMVTGLAELLNCKSKKMKLQLYNDSHRTKATFILILFCAIFIL